MESEKSVVEPVAESVGSIAETLEIIEDKLGPKLDELKVADAVVGVFFTGVVLNTGHSGVAFTPIGDMPEAVCCPKTAARMPESGKLRGRDAKNVAHFALSPNVLKSSLGVAAINALSHFVWQELGPEGYEVVMDRDAIEGINFAKCGSVALVGAFTPFIRQLKEVGADFVILEKNPDALKGDELKLYRPAEAAPEVLPKSDTVIITGTAIVNHTIDGILSRIRPESLVVIAGPTASMIPTAFFKRGVDILGGIRVTKPDVALRILAEAGSGYHLFGKCADKISFVRKR